MTPHINAVKALFESFAASKALTTQNIVKTTPKDNGIASRKFFRKNFIAYSI